MYAPRVSAVSGVSISINKYSCLDTLDPKKRSIISCDNRKDDSSAFSPLVTTGTAIGPTSLPSSSHELFGGRWHSGDTESYSNSCSLVKTVMVACVVLNKNAIKSEKKNKVIH